MMFSALSSSQDERFLMAVFSAKRILILSFFGVSLLSVFAVIFLGLHLQHVLTDEAIRLFSDKAREQGVAESRLFLSAERNAKMLAGAYLDALAADHPLNPANEFAQLFSRSADGAIRHRADRPFQPELEAGLFIAKTVPMSPEVQYRALMQYRLTSYYGRAWSHQLSNTYIASLDGMFATYFAHGDWARVTPANLNMRELPWVKAIAPENNRERTGRWTEVYEDEFAASAGSYETFFTSYVLPIDEKGVFRHYVGVDLALDDIIERNRLFRDKGGYTLIFQESGQLIAHPDYVAQRKQPYGVFVSTLTDDMLKKIYQAAKEVRGSERPQELDLLGTPFYVGAGRIDGPGWYLVSILPRDRIDGFAKYVVWLACALGGLSIAWQFLWLRLFLKRAAVVPLAPAHSPVSLPLPPPSEVPEQIVMGEAPSFQTVLDAIPEAVFYLRDRCIFAVNSAAVDLFGYHKEQLIGQNTACLYPDFSAYLDAGQSFYAPLMSGETFRGELKMRRADGSVFWCELVGRLVTAGQPARGTVWIFRDVGAQYLIRERLLFSEALLDIAKEGFVVMDRHFRITQCNTAFLDIFDMPEQAMIGQSLRVFRPYLKDREHYIEMRSQLKKNGEWQGTLQCYNAYRTAFACQLFVRAVKNEQHYLTHYVAVLHLQNTDTF